MKKKDIILGLIAKGFSNEEIMKQSGASMQYIKWQRKQSQPVNPQETRKPENPQKGIENEFDDWSKDELWAEIRRLQRKREFNTVRYRRIQKAKGWNQL